MAAAAFGAAALLNGPALGYLDIFFAPWLIAGFWALQSGRPLLGAALLLTAGLVKWQPMLDLPFVLIHLLEISGPESAVAAVRRGLFWRLAALGGAVALSLLAVFGFWPVQAFLYALNHPWFSGNALNLPWLEAFVLKVLFHPTFTFGTEMHPPAPPAIFQVPVKVVFWAVFGGILWRAARAEKSLGNCLLLSVLGAATYCTLNTGVHENHWFLPMLLAFSLVVLDPSGANRTIALLMAVLLNVNMFLFYGVTGEREASPVLGLDLSVPLAALYVLCWSALAFYAWKATAPRFATAGRGYVRRPA